MIVRKELSDEEQTILDEMIAIAPEIEILRRFNRDFYRLLAKGITKQQARYRHTRMINNADYRANKHLARALKKLRTERFEKMIVVLGWENVDRTSNHVERNNRSFRMLQKTRYKRRKKNTIQMSIELDLYERMLNHEDFHAQAAIPISRHRPHQDWAGGLRATG